MSDKDIARVVEIEREDNPAPWGRDKFETCCGPNYLSWVVAYGNAPLGFIIALVGVGECHILNVGVTAAWREQGLATCLIYHVVSEAVKKNAEVVWLEVRKSNLPAITLYRKLGFQEIGCRKNYYTTFNGHEDALVMRLLISGE